MCGGHWGSGFASLSFRVSVGRGLSSNGQLEVGCVQSLSSWVDTLYAFWDNITHYKTESVYFFMNSATKSWLCAAFL